jgi:ABC-type transport system involved in multi-copper enzyme maturation permease subunit
MSLVTQLVLALLALPLISALPTTNLAPRAISIGTYSNTTTVVVIVVIVIALFIFICSCSIIFRASKNRDFAAQKSLNTPQYTSAPIVVNNNRSEADEWNELGVQLPLYSPRQPEVPKPVHMAPATTPDYVR